MSIGTSIGSLDLAAVGMVDDHPSKEAFARMIEGRIRLADLNPAHAGVWVDAGVLIVPPQSLRYSSKQWNESLRNYLTRARLFVTACGGDEPFAALAAAAGFEPVEVAGWGQERPTAESLKALAALRKVGD